MRLTLLFLFALSFAVIGCGASGPTGNSVSGLVTVNGTKLSQGTVSIFPLDGQGAPQGGTIRDGNFLVTKVSQGMVRITVALAGNQRAATTTEDGAKQSWTTAPRLEGNIKELAIDTDKVKVDFAVTSSEPEKTDIPTKTPTPTATPSPTPTPGPGPGPGPGPRTDGPPRGYYPPAAPAPLAPIPPIDYAEYPGVVILAMACRGAAAAVFLFVLAGLVNLLATVRKPKQSRRKHPENEGEPASITHEVSRDVWSKASMLVAGAGFMLAFLATAEIVLIAARVSHSLQHFGR